MLEFVAVLGRSMARRVGNTQVPLLRATNAITDEAFGGSRTLPLRQQDLELSRCDTDNWRDGSKKGWISSINVGFSTF